MTAALSRWRRIVLFHFSSCAKIYAVDLPLSTPMSVESQMTDGQQLAWPDQRAKLLLSPWKRAEARFIYHALVAAGRVVRTQKSRIDIG
jgi:hypothetical protein